MKNFKIIIVIGVFIIVSVICIYFSRDGRILPGLGSFLNLAMPPEDLYDSITSKEKLAPNKRIYQFAVDHKYPGNYSIDISFDSEQKELPNLRDINIMASLEIKKDNKIIFRAKESKPNYGHYSGVEFISYRFPDDVTERTGVEAIVKIKGDIQEFLNTYGSATITISKASDL